MHYRFLEWRYAPGPRLLSGPGGELRLKPLLDRLLRELLDHPDQVLGRDYLIEHVWTRRQVNDEVLSRAIAELRGVLVDDAREPRFIETLSKGGYRWIAPVAAQAQAKQATANGEAAHAKVRRGPSRRMLAFIAVLALVTLGGAWVVMRGADTHGERAALAVDLLDARPLAADPRLEFDARFDVLGRVVYVRADETSSSSELILVDPVSRAERVLWQDSRPLRNPAVAPGGGEVAVVRWSDSGCEIWSVALVDLQRRRLTDCAQGAEGVEWIDDGNALLFTMAAADPAHAPGLARLQLRDGSVRALTTPERSEGAHVDPRISADASRLAYASKHGGEGQIWLADWPLLRERHALLKRPEPIYGHAFETQGSGLWVAGDLTRYRAINRLRVGEAPTIIGGRGALSIDIATNGASVWSEARYDGDIQLREASASSWSAIARSNRYESQPEFSADAERVALVSNRSGSEMVFVFNRPDGSVRPLPLDPRFRWVRPTWSARDPSLILTAYEDVQTRLYRYRLDTGELEPMTALETGAFHGTELDDRLFYLSGHRTSESALMQLRTGQTSAEKLELGKVTAYRASQGWLVWRNEGSPLLKAAPLPGLGPVRVIERVDDGDEEAMAVAGNDLYFVDQGSLWKVDLPAGQPVRVDSEYVAEGSSPGLAVSTRGDLAVVTLADRSIDLMIVTPR